MPRIAMIGAGSVIFTKTLMNDIMATPALQESEFALMSPTATKLRKMEAFAKDVIKENNLPAKVWATTDRRKALDGADYVVIMIQVGVDGCIPVRLGDSAEVRRGPVHRRLARAGRKAPTSSARHKQV